MAASAAAQCLYLSCRFQSLSLSSPSSSSSSSSRPYATAFKPLTSSANTSFNAFSTGLASVNPIYGKRVGRSISIVCEAGATKKPDSAAKRARQAEKRRLYNKARKSEVRTRMKKVLEELDVLRKKSEAQQEEVIGIEKLIAEAYSVIDKAVQVGTLHRNTGARRKSRLARRKKAVEIHHGWYTPAASPAATA
ncbi:30S ribosomal protein S20, chloroplastic [Cynara cardunculus var. scolymus]|uniref:Small ribosomal subunit protein bS20c n=1 Tax=Cynara cardunculus var. scolymus TaxID=59895 RepID=A0A118JVN6_CYNCS|nr:30S ribosomal protein S20, chloroplastic [Cynara cardunculus var. scolymus]KVH93057.1 Ribosomal protein S20 [Cynara cardunculus var. scolymus]